MTDPLERLNNDRQLARSREDACANLCTLANVDADGQPQARTLILREVNDRLAVFINATSPKFDSVSTGRVSIVVWLPSVAVQYRLACTTEPVPQNLVAESWLMRPDPPKRMDWFYDQIQSQSSSIESRESLLESLSRLKLDEPLTAPDNARGLFLLPLEIERLDLSQENGVHDRRRYLPGNPSWQEQVLVP